MCGLDLDFSLARENYLSTDGGQRIVILMKGIYQGMKLNKNFPVL